MAKTVVIDELHLTISIPRDLPNGGVEEVRRTLASDDFTDHLLRAARAAVRVFPELVVVRLSLAR